MTPKRIFWKLPVWLMARKDLTVSAKVVYAYIADCMGKNRCAWPGMDAIAKACKVSNATARRAVTQLERAKLLTVKRQHRRANRYRLRTN